jgi:AcrR family transcriptional regulator
MAMGTDVRSRGRPSNRDRVLDAATKVALRDGPGSVTIDAVVAESGLSRGGVLYHFPSKDALLQAMVDQDIDEVREVTGLEGAATSARRADQRAQAYFAACTEWAPERGHVALAVALANNPQLLRSWAQVQRDLDAVDLGDDDDPDLTALVARLALDGLWFSDLIDPERFTLEQRRRVVDAVLAVAAGTGAKR